MINVGYEYVKSEVLTEVAKKIMPCYHLEYEVWCGRNLLMFRRKFLTPSSECRSKKPEQTSIDQLKLTSLRGFSIIHEHGSNTFL